MPDSTFRTHIRTALANPQLQEALDGNAQRRMDARLQANFSLPEDLQTLRQRAHAVRADTLANLDIYLEQFIAYAEAKGITIHRATTAGEAVQIVLEIAAKSRAKIIAKSKTMVGEEIHLNQALETSDLKVIETDLGEFIVQLRGEPPAHIITPAVHLSRAEVGQTFHEKLGLPLTDDIPTLVAAARRVLRQTFFDADIGISGVNFGVAENGALCLLTNEGNGRMISTLPKTHIALMGIERLVPGLEDLALMLYLLPRSATGQKLTVYTSLIFSPRRPGEIDGAGQRHVILVDNGRSAMRASPLAEALFCIRCGACLNACPIFREIGGHAYVGEDGRLTPYAGPIGSVISSGLFGTANFAGLARASSLCGACKEACPVDIDLPKLLLRVRAAGASLKPPRVPRGLQAGLSLFTWITISPNRYAAAQRLAGLFSRLLPPFSNWLHLPGFTGWGYSRDLPRPALRPFRARFSSLPSESPSSTFQKNTPPSTHSAPDPAPTSTLARREQFAAELSNLGVSYSLCNKETAAPRVLEILQSLNIIAIQAWSADCLPPGMVKALETAGIQVAYQPDPELRAGLTGALAGVAETGSLVLPGGPGQPLSASLLPEVHIVVLNAGDILLNLRQAFQLRPLQEASAVAIITGPSRTADIEMTLTIGVHGPGKIYVICLED